MQRLEVSCALQSIYTSLGRQRVNLSLMRFFIYICVCVCVCVCNNFILQSAPKNVISDTSDLRRTEIHTAIHVITYLQNVTTSYQLIKHLQMKKRNWQSILKQDIKLYEKYVIIITFAFKFMGLNMSATYCTCICFIAILHRYKVICCAGGMLTYPGARMYKKVNL